MKIWKGATFSKNFMTILWYLVIASS